MALIGRIRRNKVLLVGTLAGALALFILMLMFDNPNQSFFGGSQNVIGKVEGREIDYREFQNTYDMLYRNSGGDTYGSRAALWNYFVDDAILKREAAAIGLGVSKDEMQTLQFSEDQNRLSSIIRNSFSNPQTRQVDMEQIRNYKEIITNNLISERIQSGQLSPDFAARWRHQETMVYQDRLRTKLGNMVSKGLYTPTWMAEMLSTDQGKKVDFLYVQIPFDEIDNADVTLKDADYKAYFEENKAQFKRDEETRKVDYVVFNVLPSANDSLTFRTEVADLIPAFRTAKNDTTFIESNYGTFDGAYFKKASLPPLIADTVFNMPVGGVYGPYLNDGAYNAVKVLDRKVIPDSVSARHILRSATDQQGLVAAYGLIDSLKTVIEGGGDFAELAKAFSEDPGSGAKGGELGTFGPGAMVKPFNDVCFFQAEKGKVYTVVSQFGVHLIEVLDKQFVTNEEAVQLGYVSREIVPTQVTQDTVRNRALALEETSGNLTELIANATAKGLSVETSPPLKANDYIVGTLGSGQGSRELVQWAFGTGPRATEAPSVGDVSPSIYTFQKQGQYYADKYVVAGLRSVIPAGIPSYADVKDEIEAAVINRKKAQIIMEGLKGQSSLAAMASKYNVKVDTASNISFASPFIPKASVNEPKVVATAFATDLNQTSAPIEGGSGVFVVKPTNKPAPAPGNVAQAKTNNQRTSRMVVRNGLVPALRENADIKDNRSRFF